MALDISGSVGMGGANQPSDVVTIKLLLNRFIGAGKLPGVDVLCLGNEPNEAALKKAIRIFQITFVPIKPDGRVDPNGSTRKYLNVFPVQNIRPNMFAVPRTRFFKQGSYRYNGATTYAISGGVHYGVIGASVGYTRARFRVRNLADTERNFEVVADIGTQELSLGKGFVNDVPLNGEYGDAEFLGFNGDIKKGPKLTGGIIRPDHFEAAVLTITAGAGAIARWSGTLIYTIPRDQVKYAVAYMANPGAMELLRRGPDRLCTTKGWIQGLSFDLSMGGNIVYGLGDARVEYDVSWA